MFTRHDGLFGRLSLVGLLKPDALSTHVPVLFLSFFFFFFADYKVSSCLSFVKSREFIGGGGG